jgi:DNA repair exonuclease SbcCD ATPase subunit
MSKPSHEKAYRKAYYETHKEIFRASGKKWAAKNRDKMNSYAHTYRQKPEVKAKIKEKNSTPEARAKHLAYTRAYREKNRARLNAYARAWRDAHLEQANASARASAATPESKARQKKYREENRAHLAAFAKKHRAEHKDQANAARKARYQRLRAEALAAYGNKCACCGETHPHFLSIDHINGGGKKDRAAHGCEEGGMNWYLHLAKNHPDHVQILCHNCNMAKGHYGVCPHQIAKET